jgi:hypothetical protein
VWIRQGDIVLLSLQDDEPADVILKYTPDEVRNRKLVGSCAARLRKD